MAENKITYDLLPEEIAEQQELDGVFGEGVIEARIITMQEGGSSTPALIYRGECPQIGSQLRVKLDNGVIYSGIVKDTTEADGEVLVEVQDGLTPEI